MWCRLYPNILKLLLSKNININQVDEYGKNALAWIYDEEILK